MVSGYICDFSFFSKQIAALFVEMERIPVRLAVFEDVDTPFRGGRACFRWFVVKQDNATARLDGTGEYL